MQTHSPTLDLLNLIFVKIPKLFRCTLKFGALAQVRVKYTDLCLQNSFLSSFLP